MAVLLHFTYSPGSSGQFFHAFAASLMPRYIPIVFSLSQAAWIILDSSIKSSMYWEYTQNTSSSESKAKQIHAAVIFLKLLDHAPTSCSQSPLLPVSPNRQNSSRNLSLIFSRREIRIGWWGMRKNGAICSGFTQILKGGRIG